MKISLSWLNEFVDVKDYFEKPQALGEILTRAGLELEEMVDRAKDYQFVVTGLILEKDKHPNADKLSLCKVTTGEGVVHQIVCGAQNHKANDRVIVALPGAILPGNFAIKKAAVRGVESGGMLCSYKELGLATESEGIAILPEDAKLGVPFAEYAGLNDIVFELKVTPNRADCLSHYGLAREVACLLGRELKTLKPEFKVRTESTRDLIQLEVQEAELCPRYAGRFVRNVKVADSPEWLKKRLESVGLKAINNVVDITNYVMMELGQPLHAFDARFIRKNKVTVGKAKAGEKFITLDGSELTLKGEELMIRDGEGPVAMAGVVGGKNSGVVTDTQDVFLEAAYFQPMVVRKSARGHGVETDSAYRFARGVDPSGTLMAMNRATELLCSVCGGEALDQHWDFYPHPVIKKPITIDVAMITQRLGYEAKESLFVDYLKKLGCQVEKNLHGSFTVLPPTFRFDIEMDMDLVEEYARIFGYEHIPETIPALAGVPGVNDKKYMLNRELSQIMRAQGFSEAMNFAFIGQKSSAQFIGNHAALNGWGLECSENPIAILNPLNEESNVMRTQLSYGLFKNLNSNFHYGNEYGRLFEVGTAFNPSESGEYKETQRLGILAWGYEQSLWKKEQNYPVVFEIKAAVEALLKSWNINAFTWTQPSNKGEIANFCHRGQFAGLVVEGKKVGFIGAIHPVLLEEHKIRVPAAIAELDLEILYKTQPRPYRVESISRFQAVERDYAFVMSNTIKVADVMTAIKKVGSGLVTKIGVFDVYEGEKLQAGHKSVAFRVTLQDKNATLQEAQLNEFQVKLIESLKKQFSIEVR